MAKYDDEDEAYTVEDTPAAEIVNHVRRLFADDRPHNDFPHSGAFIEREIVKVTRALRTVPSSPLASLAYLFSLPQTGTILEAYRFNVFTIDRDNDDEGSVRKFVITIAEQKI